MHRYILILSLSMMSIGILVMAGQEICSEHRKMGNGLYETFHTDGKTVYNPELIPIRVSKNFVKANVGLIAND